MGSPAVLAFVSFFFLKNIFPAAPRSWGTPEVLLVFVGCRAPFNNTSLGPLLVRDRVMREVVFEVALP